MAGHRSQFPKTTGHAAWLLTFCLVLAIFAAFGRVLENEFVALDDGGYLYQNETVSQGLTWDGVRYAFAGGHGGNWHPLTTLSHMFDCQMFGLRAGHHLAVNVLIHAASSVLLLSVLRSATGHFWASAFVAAMFALHPLRVESVAWVSQRKDVLSTLFWMLTLGSYLWYTRQPSFARYSLVSLCVAAGLMAKPMLVTLPGVLLLLDFWPLGRWQQRQKHSAISHSRRETEAQRAFPPRIGPIAWLFLEKVPWLALSLGDAYLTIVAQRSGGAMTAFGHVPYSARLANALVSYVMYFVKTVWPTRLACFYPHPALIAPDQSQDLVVSGIAAGLLLFAATLAVFYFATRRPYLLVGWLWYLGTLVPVMGFVQVGAQSMADRYTYIPLVGIYLMAAWTARDWVLARPALRPTLVLSSGFVVVACIALTWRQVGVWRDSRTLYGHALEVTKDNYRMHLTYAKQLERDGKYNEAADHLRTAVRIRPQDEPSHTRLGIVYKYLGELPQAVHHFNRALELGNDEYSVHGHLGEVLMRQGDLDEAANHFREVIARKPDLASGHFSLGLVLLRTGDVMSAEKALREAIRCDPEFIDAHGVLGDHFAGRGAWQSATHHYKQILRVQPRHGGAHFRMGQVLERAGQYDRSAEHYRHAVDLEPNNAEARQGLQRVNRARTGGQL